MKNDYPQRMIDSAEQLAKRVNNLRFGQPVTHVYNPLDYARDVHQQYLQRFAASPKTVVFLGMNPGPFGMAQTGVPFGEVAAVRDWLGLNGHIDKPGIENPARPVEGFGCTRSEVSGRRLWGLFRERFGTADAFFADHFVANYCPLVFFNQGRNLTPDKLPGDTSRPLLEACDAHLRQVVDILQPEWVVGIGAWAEKRARTALADAPVKFGRVLHPSPASPAANRGWPEQAEAQMISLGLWKK